MGTRRRVILGTVIAMLLIAGAGTLVLRLRGDGDGAYAEVVLGSIEQPIQTGGVVRPVATDVVTGAVSGRVAVVAVAVGDRVEPGDIVATLDDREARDALAAAVRGRDRAELVAGLASAEAADGEPADLVAAAVAASQAEDTRALVRRAETSLAATTILAPRAGTVVEVGVVAGQGFVAGSPIVVVAGDGRELVVDLDQTDLPLVPLGTEVRVVPDAYPDRDLPGRVVAIEPNGEADGGAVVFAATVAFLAEAVGTPPAIEDLRPGMTATVVIPSGVGANAALLVPIEAVETVGRRSFVRVRGDGDDQLVEVVLGLRAEGRVQIVAGDVRAGDYVRTG